MTSTRSFLGGRSQSPRHRANHHSHSSVPSLSPSLSMSLTQSFSFQVWLARSPFRPLLPCPREQRWSRSSRHIPRPHLNPDPVTSCRRFYPRFRLFPLCPWLIHMLLSLIFRESAKHYRSLRAWRADPEAVLPTTTDKRAMFLNAMIQGRELLPSNRAVMLFGFFFLTSNETVTYLYTACIRLTNILSSVCRRQAAHGHTTVTVKLQHPELRRGLLRLVLHSLHMYFIGLQYSLE